MDDQDFRTNIAVATLTLLAVIPWLGQPGTPVALILLGIAAMFGLTFLVRTGAHARLGRLGRALESVTLARPHPTPAEIPSSNDATATAKRSDNRADGGTTPTRRRPPATTRRSRKSR